MKPLPFARIYVSDLMSECLARGLGQSERGVLFSLLWLQHVEEGTIPASLRELRRRIGEDTKEAELATVVKHFFPIAGDGRRANHQHAEAYKAAMKAYEAVKKGGDKRRAQILAERAQLQAQQGSSATGSATTRDSSASSPGSSNQSQNHDSHEPEHRYGHPEGEDVQDALEPAAADGDDDIPF
jgi:hypothetical protein